MLKRTQRLLISIGVFVVATFVFTRVDYLINSDFYSYGLQFNDDWFGTYQILYMALFQILIVCLWLYSGNWGLPLVLEAFVLSGGQDLVYYGIWNMGVFPSGSWAWMPAVRILGLNEWLTWMQFALTITVTVIASIFVVAYNQRSK